MRNLIVLLAFAVMTAGCSSDEPMEERDQAACASYEESVAAAESGDDNEMLQRLQDAESEAYSDRLTALIGDLTAGMEANGQISQDTVTAIRSWCGLG